MVVCLEQGADLYMAQLMPLPLTVSCFTKIQIGFTFLVPAHLGSPGQRAVKRVCVCLWPPWNRQRDREGSSAVPGSATGTDDAGVAAWLVAVCSRDLDLKRPFYQKTACYGHFGREEFTWEQPKILKF